jgi:hypothetical protein
MQWWAIHKGDDIHIIPHLDLVKHSESDECVCGPEAIYLGDNAWIYTHASLDGREYAEPDQKS